VGHGTPATVLFDLSVLETAGSAVWKDKKVKRGVALIPQGSVGVADLVLTLGSMVCMTVQVVCDIGGNAISAPVMTFE
jgi:hypothetical protein